MAEGTPVPGYLTITPGGSDAPTLGAGGSSTAQSYFAQKAEEDAATGSPPPAAADPAPPIGLRDSHKGKIIAIAPDVKFVGARGQNPTPFITRAYTDDQPEHYSPDVRYEGDRAMRFNSDVSKTYGGQPGTGRGVKSDTYMDRTFPQTHSTNVRINGSPAMRKGDLFDHNGSSPDNANTVAKAQHPGPEDTKAAPKPNFWTRVWGGARVVGGVIEGAGAAAVFTGGTAADATGVGAVVGVPAQVGAVAVGANAVDNVQTGLRELWYGTPQETLGQMGAGAVAKGLGASQGTVEATKEAVGAGQGLIGGGGGAASEASTIGRELSEAERLEKLAKDAKEARDAKAAEEAAADGAGGVRVAKKAKFRRSMAERRKALLRDAKDPNSGLSQEQRDFILENNGNKVPPGMEVSHDTPLYSAGSDEEKAALDNADNMTTMDKDDHRALHMVCGDTYHAFPP